MKTIEVCPSTLRPGFSTYSPQAVKELFDGVVVSPFIDIDFENERDQQQAMENMNNMSISIWDKKSQISNLSYLL